MERGESIKSDNWSMYLNFFVIMFVNNKSINNSSIKNFYNMRKNNQGLLTGLYASLKFQLQNLTNMPFKELIQLGVFFFYHK